MTIPSTEVRSSVPTYDERPEIWPENPVEMMNVMLVHQAAALDGMFMDLCDHAAKTFNESSPGLAQPYIRLALRAQANCRSSLDALARVDRAAQRKAADVAGEKSGE